MIPDVTIDVQTCLSLALDEAISALTILNSTLDVRPNRLLWEKFPNR